MEMLCGGAILGTAAILTGEPGRMDPGAVTPAAVAGLVYLIFMGSVVGFTCYMWLLRNAPVSTVATYAYVNPVVAVVLGALLLGEPLGPRTVVGGAIIVASVAVIVVARGRDQPPPVPED
jgi:drug/metabolite transporter (DMT)-like permease